VRTSSISAVSSSIVAVDDEPQMEIYIKRRDVTVDRYLSLKRAVIGWGNEIPSLLSVPLNN
jgi:hypothetical protein